LARPWIWIAIVYGDDCNDVNGSEIVSGVSADYKMNENGNGTYDGSENVTGVSADYKMNENGNGTYDGSENVCVYKKEIYCVFDQVTCCVFYGDSARRQPAE
jgi:hypothetical protein